RVIGASPGSKLLAESGPPSLAQYKKNDKQKFYEGTTIAPATVSFTGTMTLDLGGVTVELYAFPPSHSPDNLVVRVPQDKIIFTGDILFVGCHPFLGEGNIENWSLNLKTIGSFKPDKIVPGHGPLSGKKELEEMMAYLTAFDKNAKELAKGKTQDDAAELAKELEKRLPAQNRKELRGMIEHNLRLKYLPRKKASVK
ncbi:MAG: MBL fold metallo-hydrolase, partial [Planctomycetia bacterium]